MAKKVLSKKNGKVSKGRKAVLAAYKKGKVQREMWFTDDGAPACPIANYGLAYGVKPVFDEIKDDSTGRVYDRSFNEDVYRDKVAKFFGISQDVIESLVTDWDSIDPTDSCYSNPLFARKGEDMQEIALNNFLDIFEQKAKKKTVIFG